MKTCCIAAAIILSFFLGPAARAEIRHCLPVVAGMVGPKASVAVTYERQLPDFCGEACYVMALGAFGVPITQQQIHRASGLKAGRGCYSEDLYAAGLVLGVEGEYLLIEDFSPDEGGAFLDYLKRLLSRGWPVVVSFNEDPRHHRYDTYEHFVLAVGYDDGPGVVTIMDPDLGPETGRLLAYDELIDHWQWENPDGSRGCLMYAIGGMRSGGPAAMHEVEGFLEAGLRIDYLYEAESADEYFFVLDYRQDGMELVIEARDGAGRRICRWETADLDNDIFSLSGVDRAYVTISCVGGGGPWRLLYEAGRMYPVLH
ncbi:MAG: C39 family peptidase [Deltaproteobacteria bacterium]|nr:C39 family peptidase [Candidatus Zymogenaceae bacterium]